MHPYTCYIYHRTYNIMVRSAWGHVFCKYLMWWVNNRMHYMCGYIWTKMQSNIVIWVEVLKKLCSAYHDISKWHITHDNNIPANSFILELSFTFLYYNILDKQYINSVRTYNISNSGLWIMTNNCMWIWHAT